MEALNDPTATHPMRLVQRRTGLGADLLRAWERRHGAVHPARSPGGQRLYRDADIERLLLLKQLTAEGHAISQIAALSTADLLAMASVGVELAAAEAFVAAPASGLGASELHRAREAVDRLDDRTLEAVLRSAAVTDGVVATIEGLVVPLLHWIGERWAREELSPAHEHLASGVILRVLHWMRDASTVSRDAPGIAFATTQGEQHELGIQATAAIAAAAGWRVTFLGADLPVDAIVSAVRSSGVAVAAFSIVAAEGAARGLEQLLAIRAGLPAQVAMVTGGRGAAVVADRLAGAGIEVLASIPGFRDFLATRQGKGRGA